MSLRVELVLFTYGKRAPRFLRFNWYNSTNRIFVREHSNNRKLAVIWLFVFECMNCLKLLGMYLVMIAE